MAVVEVVKYDGSSDVLAWKYPNEEMGTWTQLIVNESQEAVLFKGGKALDIFASGRHTLSTANIPLLSKLVNLPFGGESPFKAEVWFINKLHTLDIKWGTVSPIQIQDPKYNLFVPVRAFGQFGIQIQDSKKFLIKLVGTMSAFDTDTVSKYFKGLYMTKVKDAISTYIVKEKVTVLEINAYLTELSESLKQDMEKVLEEYGISLLNFYVNDVNVPEEDPAVQQLKAALAKRAEMDIVGYDYTQERSFDTLEGAAKNTGGGQGGLMGAGIGLGMGLGLGGNLGSQMGDMARNINTNGNKQNAEADNTEVCLKCGAKVSSNTKFCQECGTNLKKKCPKCEANLKGNAKFCQECGEKLE